jgi:8-oxo-dGTP pyrophosphatase MutT (NUDIX family)
MFAKYLASFDQIWNQALPLETRYNPMSRRIEHWHNPAAPPPNSLVPASNMLVTSPEGHILLQRRRDTGQWALPGGVQELGETPSQCAIRECEEETGVHTKVVGLLGVYSDPAHLVEYTSDGEFRQEFEVTFIGTPSAESQHQTPKHPTSPG